MKKIGLFLLSVFGIFGFGASFANPIITEPLKTCYKLNNVEIDNYNVIITENYVPKSKTKDEEKIIDDTVDGSIMSGDAEEDIIVLKNYASKNKTKDEEIAFDGSVGGFHIIPEDEEEDIIVPKIFVPKANDCIRLDHEEDLSFRDLYLGKVVNVLLIDKDVDMSDITEDLLDNDAIFLGKLWDSDCYIDSDCDEMEIYDIINNDGNYELVLTKIKNFGEMRTKLKKFPFYWGLAVILETLILFFIAKLFWKENQILNKKLFLFGIIPTTITLPFLWFVLPLLLGDGLLYIVVGEILVAIAEAIMIKYGLNISREKAIIASIMCNLFSFLVLLWGSLIGDYYDAHSIVMDIPIWIGVYSPLLYFLIEFLVLCITGRIWCKDEISNKRIILTGIIAPIVVVLLFIFLLRIIFILDASERLETVAIAVSIFIEVLLIKYLLKISWGKTIIMVILSHLFPTVISFLVSVLY